MRIHFRVDMWRCRRLETKNVESEEEEEEEGANVPCVCERMCACVENDESRMIKVKKLTAHSEHVRNSDFATQR